MLVNNVVDTGGITYAFRVAGDAGVGYVDVVRAFVAADAIFGIEEPGVVSARRGSITESRWP